MISDLLGVTGLAILAWLTIFAMGWMFVIGAIPANSINAAFWGFFVLVGVSASALSRGKK